MQELHGRAAFVTGPAKGMGSTITLALARSGADVILAGRDIAAIEEVAGEVRTLGRTASVRQCDVTNDESVAHAVTGGKEALGGRLDGLVCIAGTTGPFGKPAWQSTVGDYRNVLGVNGIGNCPGDAACPSTLDSARVRKRRPFRRHIRFQGCASGFSLRRYKMVVARADQICGS